MDPYLARHWNAKCNLLHALDHDLLDDLDFVREIRGQWQLDNHLVVNECNNPTHAHSKQWHHSVSQGRMLLYHHRRRPTDIQLV